MSTNNYNKPSLDIGELLLFDSNDLDIEFDDILSHGSLFVIGNNIMGSQRIVWKSCATSSCYLLWSAETQQIKFMKLELNCLYMIFEDEMQIKISHQSISLQKLYQSLNFKTKSILKQESIINQQPVIDTNSCSNEGMNNSTDSSSSKSYKRNKKDNDGIAIALYKTSKKCTSIQDCQCIKRIIYGLRYYSSLSMDDTADLIEFCTEKYKFIIDDFTHILLAHNNDYCTLNEIYNNDIRCGYGQHCLSIIRYKTKTEYSIDCDVVFWRDLFDTIHCYILHAFQMKYRSKSNQSIYSKEEKQNEIDELRKDKFYANISNKIKDIGYTFYYWDYYKDNDENCNIGYKYSQLFISKKYKHLKRELLNNDIHKISMAEYENIKFKSIEYSQCEISLNISSAKYVEARLHCGIKHGLPLGLDNLIAIISYTDLSSLAVAFQSTFYAQSNTETLFSIKNRNREFWNLSKLICETIECYGDKLGQKKSVLPFYCMSSSVILSSFNIKFCAPISMSHNIEVLNRLQIDDGMILQLNNGANYNSCHLRKFNCSWLSKYSLENEQLFIFGQHSLRLESVKMMNSNKNKDEDFGVYFKSMFYLDCMINGIKITEDELKLITKQDLKILRYLIKHYLNPNKSKNEYPKYINDTFQNFCHYQKKIVINLRELDRHFIVLKGLLISTKFKNMVLIEKITKLFIHCDEIIISDINNGYSFELLFLLNEIQKCTRFNYIDNGSMCIKIKVSRGRYYDDKNSWIYNHYKTNKFALETEFKAQNWDISITKERDKYYIWDVVTLRNS